MLTSSFDIFTWIYHKNCNCVFFKPEHLDLPVVPRRHLQSWKVTMGVGLESSVITSVYHMMESLSACVMMATGCIWMATVVLVSLNRILYLRNHVVNIRNSSKRGFSLNCHRKPSIFTSCLEPVKKKKLVNFQCLQTNENSRLSSLM